MCARALAAHDTCVGCGQARFCSPQCAVQGAAAPWAHSPLVCRAYAGIASASAGLSPDDQNALRFLAHALAARAAQPVDPDARFSKLCQLVGSPGPAELQAAGRLAPALEQLLGGLGGAATAAGAGAAGSASGVDVAEVASLLKKEQLNSYGVLVPQRAAAALRRRGGGGAASADEDGERLVLGSGIYHMASLVNHECLPNAARFDAFDAPGPGPGSTAVSLRALHDLPAGTEVTQSYVPLGWGLSTRRQQLQEVYGFTCCCPRCLTEEQWSDESDDDEYEEMSEGGDATMDAEEEAAEAATAAEGQADGGASSGSGARAAAQGDEGPLDPGYLEVFLLKFMCPKDDCAGTLAPLALTAPAGAPGAVPPPLPPPEAQLYECNYCGSRRSEAQFLQEIGH